MKLERFETRREAAAYLGAMIDGEGTVGKDRAVAYVYNSDPGIITAVEEACRVLGIPSTTGKPKSNGVIPVSMGGLEGLGIIQAEVPMASTAKRDRIERALARRRYLPLDEARLRAEVAAGRSVSELAKLFDCGAEKVRGHLTRYGLAARKERGRISESDLRAAVGEGLTLQQVADRLECSKEGVWSAMQKYGLKTRRARQEAAA